MFHIKPIPSSKKINPFKLKSPILQVASKPKISSSGSFRLKTDILDSEDNEIFTVKILSNWGNPTHICCSYMQFLSNTRRSINPIKMMSVPKTDENILQKLNGDIVKPNEEMWRINWPPDEDDTFSIVFVFQKHQSPSFIRIWNPQDNLDESVKDIEIYSGKTLIGKEEIPKGFGKDIRTRAQEGGSIKSSQSMQFIQQIFPQLAPNSMAPVDKYGCFPVFKVRKITIEVLSNYGNPNVFGLGSVGLINEKDEYVIRDDINRVVVENCSDFSDPLQLIPQNKGIPEKCTFVAHSNFEKHPSITFYLENVIVLKRIILINLDVGPSGFDCEVNHCKIYTNDKLEWTGKLLCTRPKDGVKPQNCRIYVTPQLDA